MHGLLVLPPPMQGLLKFSFILIFYSRILLSVIYIFGVCAGEQVEYQSKKNLRSKLKKTTLNHYHIIRPVFGIKTWNTLKFGLSPVGVALVETENDWKTGFKQDTNVT